MRRLYYIRRRGDLVEVHRIPDWFVRVFGWLLDPKLKG